MQIFEDIIHNVASGKVLFARTLLLSEESSESDVINYLEKSCPLLWKYASSWRSTDTDVITYCFIALRLDPHYLFLIELVGLLFYFKYFVHEEKGRIELD